MSDRLRHAADEAIRLAAAIREGRSNSGRVIDAEVVHAAEGASKGTSHTPPPRDAFKGFDPRLTEEHILLQRARSSQLLEALGTRREAGKSIRSETQLRKLKEDIIAKINIDDLTLINDLKRAMHLYHDAFQETDDVIGRESKNMVTILDTLSEHAKNMQPAHQKYLTWETKGTLGSGFSRWTSLRLKIEDIRDVLERTKRLTIDTEIWRREVSIFLEGKEKVGGEIERDARLEGGFIPSLGRAFKNYHFRRPLRFTQRSQVRGGASDIDKDRALIGKTADKIIRHIEGGDIKQAQHEYDLLSVDIEDFNKDYREEVKRMFVQMYRTTTHIREIKDKLSERVQDSLPKMIAEYRQKLIATTDEKTKETLTKEIIEKQAFIELYSEAVKLMQEIGENQLKVLRIVDQNNNGLGRAVDGLLDSFNAIQKEMSR